MRSNVGTFKLLKGAWRLFAGRPKTMERSVGTSGDGLNSDALRKLFSESRNPALMHALDDFLIDSIRSYVQH